MKWLKLLNKERQDYFHAGGLNAFLPFTHDLDVWPQTLPSPWGAGIVCVRPKTFAYYLISLCPRLILLEQNSIQPYMGDNQKQLETHLSFEGLAFDTDGSRTFALDMS